MWFDKFNKTKKNHWIDWSEASNITMAHNNNELSPSKMSLLSTSANHLVQSPIQIPLDERFVQLQSLLSLGPTLFEGKSINCEVLCDVLIAVFHECQRYSLLLFLCFCLFIPSNLMSNLNVPFANWFVLTEMQLQLVTSNSKNSVNLSNHLLIE